MEMQLQRLSEVCHVSWQRKHVAAVKLIGNGGNTRVTVQLIDGRKFLRECGSFRGMPDQPLSREELRSKFMLAADMGEAASARLYNRLDRIETVPKFSLL